MLPLLTVPVCVLPSLQVWGLKPLTLQRVALIPKEGQPPPEGQSQWEGASAVTDKPFAPARAGDWRWACQGWGKGY